MAKSQEEKENLRLTVRMSHYQLSVERFLSHFERLSVGSIVDLPGRVLLDEHHDTARVSLRVSNSLKALGSGFLSSLLNFFVILMISVTRSIGPQCACMEFSL